LPSQLLVVFIISKMPLRPEKAVGARASVAHLKISQGDTDILQQNRAVSTVFAAKSNWNDIFFCIFTTLYLNQKKNPLPHIYGMSKFCIGMPRSAYFASSRLKFF